MVATEKSEDTLVLFACNPQYSNYDKVLKELEKFFKLKQQNDPTDRFNFIAFEANGPLYFEDFLFDYSYIIDALKGLKNNLAPANLSGGIMIAITFIIDVFKIVGGKCFRLLVVSDKSAHSLQNVEILQTLVDQVKDFPFFIDFVSIKGDDPRKELIMMKFAKKNGGEVYFIEDERNLERIFGELAQKKKIDSPSYSKNQSIDPSFHAFYENLADDLWVVDSGKKVRCQICGQEGGELVQCPKCESVNHPSCLAMWASQSNIGLSNVFRCLSCYNLLKLPSFFIDEVNTGKYNPYKIQSADQTELLHSKERESTPQLKNVPDPLGILPSEGESDESEFIFKKDNELEIQFCPDCSTLNFPEATHCSKCGRKL